MKGDVRLGVLSGGGLFAQLIPKVTNSLFDFVFIEPKWSRNALRLFEGELPLLLELVLQLEALYFDLALTVMFHDVGIRLPGFCLGFVIVAVSGVRSLRFFSYVGKTPLDISVRARSTGSL